MVVQTAAALVLLVGSGLLFQSFRELRSVDPGFDVEDIFTFQVGLERRMFTNGADGNETEAARLAQFHYAFMDRMAALPGVQSVGLVDRLPLDEGAGVPSFFDGADGERRCVRASREYDLRRRKLLSDDGHWISSRQHFRPELGPGWDCQGNPQPLRRRAVLAR